MPPSLPLSTGTPQAAYAWSQSGASGIPIAPGGTKRPATKWQDFQVAAPTLEQTEDWFGNGHAYGLAIIMGQVSGNLEMTELEGVVVTDVEQMGYIYDQLEALDAFEVWHTVHNGYLEQSPTGGLHFIYRISDHPVPGNEKIARRPATPEELAARPTDKIKVLAETRGEGGYVIVAPTSGLCHPTGEAWRLLAGEPGVVPTITWAERNLLHEVFRRALDRMPVNPPPTPLPAPSTALTLPQTGLKPGDDFERRVSWDEILIPRGWTVLSRRLGGETHWVRPGKESRDGMSATTGHAGDRDRLFVFSTSTEFQSETPYTKFAAYTILEHGGDFRAAASELARLGFGDRVAPTFDQATADEVMGVAPGSAVPAVAIEEPTDNHPRKLHRWDDIGNAGRLWDEVKGRFHYVEELKSYQGWTGKRWERDYGGALKRQQMAMVERMYVQAAKDGDEGLRKWAKTSSTNARVDATMTMMAALEGVTVKAETFDQRSELVNLDNGVLDTATMTLLPHDPKYLMTRLMGAAYRPEATCPTWDKYLADVLPDESLRRYVQRAVGYTLLGEADHRSIFFIHGPGGTGKSTFMETIQAVFGDYGTTAAAGTFRAKRSTDGPSADLHDLKGKRFVATSETTETTSFEEDLLKRLAGGDRVRSRDLYERNQSWVPECVVWMATNHAPRFSSDDDAIWQRAKLIPFLTKLTGKGEITDMRRRLLAELDGILNWVLAGLADFKANGLGEPEDVREAVKTVRQEADPVQRFLLEKLADGVLELDPEGEIASAELYEMYNLWSRQSGERALGPARLRNRLDSSELPIQYARSALRRFWRGVRRAHGASILGTMET